MATSMLKVASDIYKMPLYRNAHSPENSSDEWAFFFPCIKFTFVVTQIATKSWIKNHLIFSKILEVRGTKMKKIQKNYERTQARVSASTRTVSTASRRRAASR